MSVRQEFCKISSKVNSHIILPDGSVSSLLEHCLGFKRDERDERSEAALASAASPLTRYLASSSAPELSRVSALASEHYQEDAGDTDHTGGPLHVLLSASPAPCSALPPIVSVLLEAGARLDQRDNKGNTPLLCLASLLQRAEWGVAAEIAKLFCTRNDCDVNSGTAMSKMSSSRSNSLIHFVCIGKILQSNLIKKQMQILQSTEIQFIVSGERSSKKKLFYAT